jgi:hypothetical protein
MLGMLAMPQGFWAKWWSAYAVIFLILLTFLGMGGLSQLKCPQCKTRLPPYLPMKPWPSAPALNFCPYCGIDLDSAHMPGH